MTSPAERVKQKYRITFWVKVKREAFVEAVSEDAAFDIVANGNVPNERDLDEDYLSDLSCDEVQP